MKNKVAHYWDTSALLALVFQEEATPTIRAFVKKTNSLPGYTTFFTLLEMESALSRRLTEGSCQTEQLPEIRLALQEIESALALLWPDSNHLKQGQRVISDFGLRPGDAMQLASAKAMQKSLPNMQFVCLDTKLRQAACGLGLAVRP